MTESEEVATKAPESDVQTVPSDISAQDTIAQTGPSMGEHCTTDRPTPEGSGKPKGSVSQINGVDCYVTKPESYPQAPAKLLLLFTSGPGIQSTNNQLQADEWAKQGFVVVAPDQFEGDPSTGTTLKSDEDLDESVLEQIKMRAAETIKSFMIDMWLARHTPEKVLPILSKAIDGAKEEFADCLAHGAGLYGVGYCFGAKYVLMLGAPQPKSATEDAKAPAKDDEAAVPSESPVLKVGAIAHGTLITSEDVESVKIPISMACVKNDSLFPDDVREQGRASLELNAIEHEIIVYDNVPHGFAVLGDYDDESIKEAQVKAFEQMSQWLNDH